MTALALRAGSWCGEREHTLGLPESWDVTVASPARKPALTRAEVEAAVARPVAGPPLAEVLAAGRSLAILVEDHTRPAPIHDALAFVIAEARRAGMPPASIKVLLGLGTHVLDRREILEPKLRELLRGEVEVVAPACGDAGTLRFVGTTRLGVPVHVNRLLADADVRITISGVYPHDDVGFSGGAKILIGGFGLETIQTLHQKHALVLRGRELETAFRRELEDIGDMVGLHYSINLVLNAEKEVAAVAAGSFRDALRHGARVAQESLGVRVPRHADVVISNAYPFDTSLSVIGKSTWPFTHCRAPRRIVVTALCDCSAARVPFRGSAREERMDRLKQGLYLSQTKAAVKRLATRTKLALRPAAIWDREFVVYVPHLDGSLRDARPRFVAGAFAFYSWPELLESLRASLPSAPSPRVAVFPCAPLCYPLPESDVR